MESVSSMKLGIVIILIQVMWCGIDGSQPCSTGFGSDLFLFRVPREQLQMDTVIGSIVFNVCSGRTHTVFKSTDTRYHVQSDGTVKLNTQVTLHNGYNMFSVHAWDSMGKEHTASVRVEHQGRASYLYNQQEDVDGIKSAQNKIHSVLEFPKSGGLQRRKRDWVIPPIVLMENDPKGPYPKRVVQIKSNIAKEIKMEYSISGEGAGEIFTIAKSTGWLSVSRPLDREAKDKYVLLAHAYSPTDPSVKEEPIEIIVQVMDQNDNSPVFTQNPFLGSVPEASKIGVEFMTITATDADDPDTDNAVVRYSIISQTPPLPTSDMFAINPVSGAIRVKADGLDRAKYPEYNLEIQAADQAGEGRATKGKAIITVTDNNDKSSTKVNWLIPPILLMENDVRGPFPKPIVQIRSIQAKETPMVYSITGEGADLPPVGLFTIAQNGWLSVSRSLDRETKAKYVLVARAHSPTDPSIKEDPIEVIFQVMDQNDNSPVFTQNPFLGSVPKTAKIGVEFMTITATDADDPDTDNAVVRYSIISQTPPEPKPNMFAINPVTGAIQVNADGLDREKYPEYNLEIQAADQAGEGRTIKGKAIITVTDNNDKSSVNWLIPPISLMENDVKGPFPKPIVQIRSIQAKETPMVFSITGEGADLPPVGLFTIARSTGWLSVSRPLDRETKAKYVLVARAHSPTDPSVKEDPIEIIFQVMDQNDNSPVFTQNPFLGSVPEASKIGVEFMTITATDADDPDTDNADVRYSIISQTPPEPKPNMFDINPVSGAIRVNADGLDRAKYPEYNLEIQAADQAGEGRAIKGKAIITVTDNNDKSSTKVNWVIPPISLMENDVRGPFPKHVVQIKSIQAKETPMVYSITGEGVDQPPVGLFTIARSTGWLSVSRPLDREAKAKYVLLAHAYSPADPSVKEDPIEIIVQVMDQNDNSPVFTQNPFLGSVPETAKIGVEFMTITATDADDPDTDNAVVKYSIISQTPPLPTSDMFAINPVSGAIRVNADGLDRAKYPEYTLEIQAADQAGEGRSTTGKAIITVTVNNGN